MNDKALEVLIRENAPEVLIDSEKRIGQFEILKNVRVPHAFSYGDGNMAFNKAPDEAGKLDVKARLEKYLENSGMEGLDKSITLSGGTSCRVVDLDKAIVAGEVKTDEMGAMIDADAVFTTKPGVPILLKPADCFGVLFTAKREIDRVSGPTHAGRRQLGNKIVVESADFMEENYGVARENILVAVTSGLGQEHHVIRKKQEGYDGDNIVRVLGNQMDYWRQYATIDPETGDWRLDDLAALKDQLREAGIPEENIQIDERDVYEQARQGKMFSQRYSNESGEPTGRFVVGIQNPFES